MKPLSVLNYSSNNKKKVISSAVCICVSVFLIYAVHVLFSTLLNSVNFCCIKQFKYISHVLPQDDKLIGDNTINMIKKSKNIEKIIPAAVRSSQFDTLCWSHYVFIYHVKENDITYLINKLNIKLKKGRLPKKDTNEIVIDYRIAENKGLKLGDYMGHEADKSENMEGKYKIVGILEGESAIGIVSLNSISNNIIDDKKLLNYGMLTFFKNGREALGDKTLVNIPKEDARVRTYSNNKEELNKNMINSANTIINIIMILIIVVISLSVGNLIYVHFMGRRKEFGILSALGYSNISIIKKTFYEITFMNITGFVFGIILGIVSGYLAKIFYFNTLGLTPDILSFNGLTRAFSVPIFTAIVTVIPVSRMISNIDPINIIEGVN